jgi:hypothetical protein
MMRNVARLLLVASLCLLGATRTMAAGETAMIDGIAPETGGSVSLAVTNLTPAASRCTVAVQSASGERVAAPISFTLRPFEERPFLDATTGATGAAARAVVACSSDFSTVAVLADRNGRGTTTLAATKAATALETDEELPPCSAGAQCFDAQGLVHKPTSEQAVGRVAFPAPSGVASRFVATVDVKVGPWYEPEPTGKHLIYWFVVSKNFDMPGMLYFRGPSRSEAFARHGMHLTHPQKIKIIKKWEAQVGRTYHVVNDYNMAAKRYTVTITDAETGEVQVVLSGKPNVTSFGVKRGSNFLFDMGFPENGEPTEVPSFDWEYSNVHVEAFVK